MCPKKLVYLLMAVQLVKAGVQPINLLPNNTVCGISSYLDQFPWMVLLIQEIPSGERYFSYSCILINKRYVITSTTSLQAPRIGNYKIVGVRLGEYNLKTDPDCIRSIRGVKCAPSPIDIDLEEQITPERYVFDAESNIALLRLKKEVEYTETVRPICLFDTPEGRSKTYVGQKLTVAGYARNSNDIRKQSLRKRKIQVPVTDLEACKVTYSGRKIILKDDEFCAGGEEGEGVCLGDIGNPLMVATADENAKVHWYLVGVVTVGVLQCGKKDMPAIFTNVSAHIPWILNKLRP